MKKRRKKQGKQMGKDRLDFELKKIGKANKLKERIDNKEAIKKNHVYEV